MLAAALGCAVRGWAVFPCHPANKQPLLIADVDASGNRVRGSGGLKKASVVSSSITQWWTRWPKAMIGLPTGANIGAFVIDIDAGADDATGEVFTAEEIKQRLERELGESLPTTWTCSTPRGGLHLYFRPLVESKMPGNRAGMLPRVDVRGEGGYVVAPPSIRSDGKSYMWLIAPEEAGLAQAPASLLALLTRNNQTRSRQDVTSSRAANPRQSDRRRNYAEVALKSELEALASAVPGTRNDSLFRASLRLGQLTAAGALDMPTVRSGLEAVAQGWPEFSKSLGTIESGLQHGLKEPRDLRAVGSIDMRPAVAVSSSDSGAMGGDLNRKLAQFELTDLGNARRFVERNRDRLLSSKGTGWLFWQTNRWSSTGAESAVVRGVHIVIDGLKAEALTVEDEPQPSNQRDNDDNEPS